MAKAGKRPKPIKGGVTKRELWAAVYPAMEESDLDGPVLLYTVARDQTQAEYAFGAFLEGRLRTPTDIKAPDVIENMALVLPNGELEVVFRTLRTLGFKPILPQEGDLTGQEIERILTDLLGG